MKSQSFTYSLFLFSAIFLTSPAAHSDNSAAIKINVGSSYPQSYYQAEGDIDYPVYNIGLYEATSNHGWRYIDGSWQHYRERGTATIYIEDQGSAFALALGSYEPVDWILEGPGVNNAKQILLYGYHHHTVSGQTDSTEVIESTYENRTGNTYLYSSGGYRWPHGASGGIQQLLGHSVSSFAGTYQATRFTIESTAPSIPPLLGEILISNDLNNNNCVEATSENGTSIILFGTSSIDNTLFEWTSDTGEIVPGSELSLTVGLNEIKEVSLQLTAVDGRIITLSKSVCVTDTTPPVVNILSPSEGEVFTGNNLMLEVDISDTVDKNITSYSASIGDSFTSELSDGYSRVKFSKPVRDSQQLTTITVEASDNSGNTASSSVDIYKSHDNGILNKKNSK